MIICRTALAVLHVGVVPLVGFLSVSVQDLNDDLLIEICFNTFVSLGLQKWEYQVKK